jgi:hypothetical protein
MAHYRLANFKLGQPGGSEPPPILAVALVMLVWGVASEALREIITGFLDEVRFE